jgi:Flp pilus assembly protein TadG
MVELALVLPLLLMLVVGIVEFGRAYSAQVSIQAAAREGARALALRNDGAVDGAVRSSAGAADISSITSSGCPESSSTETTSYATVTVEASVTFGIPFVDLGTKTLTATARMRCGL